MNMPDVSADGDDEGTEAEAEAEAEEAIAPSDQAAVRVQLENAARQKAEERNRCELRLD